MLEEGHQRHRGHQDPEEPSQLRQAGADRGLNTIQIEVIQCMQFLEFNEKELHG